MHQVPRRGTLPLPHHLLPKLMQGTGARLLFQKDIGNWGGGWLPDDFGEESPPPPREGHAYVICLFALKTLSFFLLCFRSLWGYCLMSLEELQVTTSGEANELMESVSLWGPVSFCRGSGFQGWEKTSSFKFLHARVQVLSLSSKGCTIPMASRQPSPDLCKQLFSPLSPSPCWKAVSSRDNS